jgi:penicillin-insensitive murein endopeptidase
MRSGLLASFCVLLISSAASGEENTTAAAVTTAVTTTAVTTTAAITTVPLRPEAPDSVSCGSTNRGALSDAAMLPGEGVGFVMAEPWRSRGSRFGTKELVGLIQRSSAAVAQEHEGGQLSVADLSKEQGGPIASHRSHQNGRDVDLIYYAMDAEGRPFYPDSHMAYYSGRGRATYAKAPAFVKDIPERYFDLARNWSLVRNMMLDEAVEVEHIFVSNRVKRWLLRYAQQIDEAPELLKAATRVLHAPRDVKGHNDHMHVRISCSADDKTSGRCRSASAPKPRRARRWHRHMRCPRPVPVTPVLPQI